MPELAAGFAIGAALSLIASFLFAYFQLSKYRSLRYLNIQKNLAVIGFRWNDLEGRLEPDQPGANKREVSKARNTYIMFGAAATVLSWLGLFFLLLMWVSITKLVKNRLEIHIFDSVLAKAQQTENDIQAFMQQLKSLGFD